MSFLSTGKLPKKKYPPALLLALDADRYEASECTFKIIFWYLYSYTIGYMPFGGFPAPGFFPLESLTIWYDQYNVVQYSSFDFSESDSSVLYGNYVDYLEKSILIDSLYIDLFEIDNSVNQTFDDTMSITLAGSITPDSLHVPRDSIVKALNYYGIYNGTLVNSYPIILNANIYDVTWYFDEDSTGREAVSYTHLTLPTKRIV